MVVKGYIRRSLYRFDRQYVTALSNADSAMAVYFSKLATIEYCGWIEETMDSIVLAYAKGRIGTEYFRKILGSRIRSTHGFQYEKHFCPLLFLVVGIPGCEKLQLALDRTGDLSILVAELDTYTKHRNDAAHTHVNRVLPTYPSPSATIGSFERVFPILKQIYAMRNVVAR